FIANTEEGVFGFFSSLPEGIGDDDLTDLADEDDIREGEAFIRCTLPEAGLGDYKINIVNVDLDEENNRNFIIEVTDEHLLSESGGIVQGMSGSPIIQDGRLIGAVTHVFISDPTKGYGISVMRMLEAMPGIIT
ncbi:MAG: SpoIVB peptidase, partial [Clostridia bacterium]|nr:SpoIVB peptidase [Clostridia bacterium]